jgi:hypothetical protein
MDEGRLFFTQRDSLQKVNDKKKINAVLTDPAFWSQVRGNQVFFFQTDSVMCANSNSSIVDFMTNYAWVGAPWNQDWHFGDLPGKDLRVGNGGFSVRNRSFILDLLNTTAFQEGIPEDYWYSYYIPLNGGKVPSFDRAKEFALELVFYPKPVGLHKFWDYHAKDLIKQVMPNCPAMLAIGPETLLP